MSSGHADYPDAGRQTSHKGFSPLCAASMAARCAGSLHRLADGMRRRYGARYSGAGAWSVGGGASSTPTLTRLTDDGCCRNPVWHPDGMRVLYTDAIPGQQLAGTYAVPADGSGAPSMFWPSAATLSPDGARVAFPDFAAKVTRVQEIGKSSIATLANNTAYVWFSADGRQLAWLERAPGPQPAAM